ncbi:MAG: type VI secretion system contractile sheath small subunit [Isosphaeraceae bacterium]|nr:type VI secretion system contractile sheath small subunit [Isosphaeraceae bacterium]
MSSLQGKLDRVRRPRVQIKYEVETGGAKRLVELPLVVGVLADLSGQPKEALRALKDRKLTQIDRDNFDKVLAQSTPRVAFKVDNKLTNDGTQLPVELEFKSIEDFDPAKVAERIPATKKLLEMRNNLTQLMSKMEGKQDVEDLLTDILSNADKAKQLAEQLGIKPGTEETGA